MLTGYSVVQRGVMNRVAVRSLDLLNLQHYCITDRKRISAVLKFSAPTHSTE